MDLGLIRKCLADGLGVVDGFRAYASAAGSIALPAVVVGQPRRIKYDSDYTGTAIIELPIRALVPRVNDVTAQETVDALLSTGDDGRSLVMALREISVDTFSPRPWRTLSVSEASEPEAVEIDNTHAVSVELILTIKA